MIRGGTAPKYSPSPDIRAILSPVVPADFSEKLVGEYHTAGHIHWTKALTALKAYDVGKPLVIEETSPLHCGIEEFGQVVDWSRKRSDGYVGFYWGKTIDEYRQRKDSIAAGIMAQWLEFFRTEGTDFLFGVRVSSMPPRPRQPNVINGRHQQQNQNHETAGLQLPRPGIPPTQNPRNP